MTGAKDGEAGMAGYDRWFAGYANQGPNNASLTSVALYTAQVPAFRALLAQEGDSLPRFYARVKEIAGASQGRTRRGAGPRCSGRRCAGIPAFPR